jgi:tRNA-dihydrouridine synthase B
MGVRIARKHVGWYLQKNSGNDRRLFNRLETPAEQLHFIEQLFLNNRNKEVLAA